MATPKKKKTGEGLYKKRYATLKEHRAAVAARKTLKNGKNIGPVAHGASYAKALTASKKKANPTPKASTPKASTPKASTPKSDPQRNTGSGRDGSFGLGTSGKGRPSDKPPTTRHRGGQRSRPGNREAVKAQQEKRRQGAREVSNRARLANPGRLPMRPAANPSKGHRYKKPFGPIMVYDGTKYVRTK